MPVAAAMEIRKAPVRHYTSSTAACAGLDTVTSWTAAMSEHGPPAIPIDSHPCPVLEYTLSDGNPQVTATNSAFEQAFDGAVSGEPVADVFDGFGGLGAAGEPALVAQLAAGDDIKRYVTGPGSTQPYLVQHAATSETGGFLVFTAVDGAETPASVDDVASVLSHELRNPLDVANAHLQAARETGEPAHFDAVSDAHDRMSQLIQDVLTLARGEEAITATESVSIQSVATEAWAAVETQGADLVMPATLPTADADPDRVRRLFENLFRNAVEHGRPGEQRGADDEQSATSHSQITVTVGPLEDGFYVADSGAGIPRGERDAVFTPGYTTATSGAGLGLAIVDRIVGAHSWELTLTTSAEGGARFEVRFHA